MTVFQSAGLSIDSFLLRIIRLYEADWNLLIKYFWAKKLVNHCETYQCLGDDQEGSRTGRSAIDVAIRKILTFTYSRLTRTNFGIFDNDAKSCYDRILPSIAMIASRKFGMPEKLCNLHGTTLKDMRHSIKTNLGPSKSYYSNCDLLTLFGSRQGSGGSPCLWLILSIILIRILKQLARKYMDFCNIDRTTRVSRCIDAFVDDSTAGTNDAMGQPMTSLETRNNLAHTAQTWERLLTASGGKLELTKCYYYLLIWAWLDGQPQPMKLNALQHLPRNEIT